MVDKYTILLDNKKPKTKEKVFEIKKIVYICTYTKATGRIPGKEMRIKENPALQRLAKVAGKTPKELSDFFISKLLKGNIIDDNPDFFGAIFFDLNELTVLDASRIIKEAGIPSISNYIDDFISLILMGDGDCPECGGNLRIEHFCERAWGGIWGWKTEKCNQCDFEKSDEPDWDRYRD